MARAGLELSELVRRLDTLIPRRLAASWDNVGLLVEPTAPKQVHHALLTNDLTEAVLSEAVSRGSDLVISYHPPLFRPLKRLTLDGWKQRILVTCLEKRIAVYSPHTCLDAIEDGVNDWLCEAFAPLQWCRPLDACDPTPGSVKIGFTLSDHESSDSGPPGWLEELKNTCGGLRGVSLDVVRQTVRKEKELRSSAEDQRTVVEVTLDADAVHHLKTICRHLEGVQYHISRREAPLELKRGAGRMALLQQPLPLADAVRRVKEHLAIPQVRVSRAVGAHRDAPVSSVAVCAGSGGSLLENRTADLLLTGEMSHHELLEATHRGSHVMLCEHSNTERGFLPRLADRLDRLFSQQVTLEVSEVDRDPIEVM